MIVYFLGSNIPLQGIHVIKAAQKILSNEKDIEWQIFTGKPWIPFDEHVARMRQADIVLGIFGTTRKTQMVIPNKVYEGLAVAKPIITADTPAIRELLSEESACLIPAGNPRALANTVLRLRDDTDSRAKLGANGYAIFSKLATPKVVVSKLIHDVLFS